MSQQDGGDPCMDEKFYSRVVDTMAEGLVVADATGTLIYANEALCRLLGYAREELVGQPAKDFISPPHASGVPAAIGSSRAGRCPPL